MRGRGDQGVVARASRDRGGRPAEGIARQRNTWNTRGRRRWREREIGETVFDGERDGVPGGNGKRKPRAVQSKVRRNGARSKLNLQNGMTHMASPPTLAKNARMGHPQWEWCTQRSLQVATRRSVLVGSDCRVQLTSLKVGSVQSGPSFPSEISLEYETGRNDGYSLFGRNAPSTSSSSRGSGCSPIALQRAAARGLPAGTGQYP